MDASTFTKHENVGLALTRSPRVFGNATWLSLYLLMIFLVKETKKTASSTSYILEGGDQLLLW